jgi:hemolysin III
MDSFNPRTAAETCSSSLIDIVVANEYLQMFSNRAAVVAVGDRDAVSDSSRLTDFSAAYNMWPVSPAKWFLRRFDHSAIYLLIAATYTPFLAQMKNALASAGLGIGVWLSAAVGMALKLALPGRFDRLAVILCLLLGWSGVIAYDSLASAIPSSSLWLLAIGGILYSLGALFHVWQRLRFHNAIWHGFVLLAASCHYSAVLACMPWE